MTVFKSLFAVASMAALALLPAPLQAELQQGVVAPDFTTQGALAGKAFTFRLRDALRRGPVVLYFYPKAFTQGCTLEAHAFAEASADFSAAGASVVIAAGVASIYYELRATKEGVAPEHMAAIFD